MGGDTVQVFRGHLNNLGRLNTVLDKHYQPGTKVTLVSKVTTDNGTYKSKRATVVTG